MRAFPLHLFRPLAWLLSETEKNHLVRDAKRQKLVMLFNLLYANQPNHSSSWEEVTKHAEILGALIYEVNSVLEKAMKIKGHSFSKIEECRETLLGASSAEKMSTFLQNVVQDLKFQSLRAA